MKILVFILTIIPLFVLAQPQNGKRAIDFKIQDIKGKELSLSDFKGQLVLLDFWASWCGPCRQENPNIVEAYEKYRKGKFKDAKGFTVVSISLDRAENAWKEAIQIDQLKWKNHAWDTDNSLSQKYNIRTIPYSFLIDGEGKIIAQGKELRGIGLHIQIEKQLE